VKLGHVPGTDFGPVISPDAKKRISELIQSGVDEGAELLLDGRNLTVKGYEKGNFLGPTILTNVKVSCLFFHLIFFLSISFLFFLTI
jgi:malonate-semialdehyde dehydrogenase (acetylating)/methylmalonate-semialdehyde dehydrogenase